MLIRKAQARDAAHLVRFINMAADDLPMHFWRKSVGPEGDPIAYGMERAARETGSFSFNSAWLAEVDGAVAACLLGYPAEDEPSPIAPDTPPVFVPLLELEALAPGSSYLNVLATYDSFRGKGCGSALLAEAEAITRAPIGEIILGVAPYVVLLIVGLGLVLAFPQGIAGFVQSLWARRRGEAV